MAEEGKLLKKDTYKISYAFLAAVLTAPAALIIYFFAGRLPGGEDIFLYGDLRIQYVAFAKLFLQSLLRGEGIGYTFHVSMGMSAIPLYTFYSLSPFNILYLLIENAELASIFLVVLKLSLSAYTFQRFSAKVLKNDSFVSVAFAVAYALNAYGMIYYYNILYLDGIYMLPVIFMLVAEAVKEMRYAKLIMAYAYVFLTQFYEGYIIGFFSLLFFILLMIIEYKKEWKKYVRTLAGFGMSVVIAALIGALFLYPTAKYLLLEFNGIDTPDWGFECNIWDIYGNLFMGQYQTIASPYPYIYCGIMSLYLVPAFFTDRQVQKKYKLIAFVMLGYLLLCSLWFPGYMFMHCFDYPDGFGFRFAYFYPFLLLAIGCYEWKNMDKKNLPELGLLFGIQLAGYLASDIGVENVTMADMISNLFFLLIFLLILLGLKKYGSRRFYQILFLCIVYVELVVNGVLTTAKYEHPFMQQRDVYQVFNSINQQAVDEIKEYDTGFYRVVNKNPYDPNDSAMNDYYGMNYFSTMEDIQLMETLNSIGYIAVSRVVNDNGGTALTQMLFSQKYEITANSAEYMQGYSDELWISNDRVLSLGFMVSDNILDTALNNDNAFENQNTLIKGLIGEDIRAFFPYSGTVVGTTENMTVLWDGERYNLLPEQGKTEGFVVFRLDDDTSLPVYAYFSQERSYKYNDSFYFISDESDRMRLRVTNLLPLAQIIELAKDENDKYFIGLYFEENRQKYNSYKESYFYCYDDTVVDRVYEQLKDNQMNILEMRGSNITAEIDAPSDKHILFTSIPYDEGWHVLVDGKEAETLAVVNDTFLAVELEEGHHELKFYYSSDTDRTGLVLSVIGIVLYIGTIIQEKIIFKKQKLL